MLELREGKRREKREEGEGRRRSPIGELEKRLSEDSISSSSLPVHLQIVEFRFAYILYPLFDFLWAEKETGKHRWMMSVLPYFLQNFLL